MILKSKEEISWFSKLESSDEYDYQILPVILKMTNFTEKKKNKESWYSNHFFLSRDGCQMCFRVDASGYKTSKDTFISVYLYMINFDHGNCNWPLLSGNFFVELLNQFSDNVHHRKNLMITNDPGNSKVLDENLSFSGWGYDKFLSNKILSKSRHVYSGNDTLYFRIFYENTPTNVVRASALQILSEYLHTPLLALSVISFIAGVIQNLIIDDTIFILVGIIMLILFMIVGVYIIGSLVGGIVWFVAVSLCCSYTIRSFPDQEYLVLFCLLLTTVTVRILLVDILHMPWGLFWGIL